MFLFFRFRIFGMLVLLGWTAAPVVSALPPVDGSHDIPPHLKFDHLTLEHGLSQSIVEDMLQDHSGFMWFATEDGLNKYDGYTFRTWRHDPDDLNTLSYSHILALQQDADSTLWIGTFGGGLNHFDPTTRTFTHYRHNPHDSLSISHDLIKDIFIDSKGRLWIATHGGLNRYDRKTDGFISYRCHPEDPLSLSHDEVNALCEDESGTLWVGTSHGLNRFYPDRGACMRIVAAPGKDGALQSDHIQCLTMDAGGRLWIGTRGGLYHMDNEDPEHPRFVHYGHDPNDPHSLGHDDVLDVTEDRTGTLWVATNGGGLNRLNDDGQTFTRYRHNPTDPTGISYDYLKCLYEDQAGVLWIGTYGGGLDKINHRLEQFAHYRQIPDEPIRVSQNIVWCFHQDHNDTLWMGTHGGGLLSLNRKTGETRTYIHDPDDPNSLNCDVIRAILVDSHDRFWVATHGGGLSRFDPRTGYFTAYTHDPEDSTSICHDELRCLYEDRRGRLWIGSYGGGLDLMDAETGTFTHFRNDPADSTSLSNDFVRAIYNDSTGRYWIGTQGGGLNLLNPETGVVRRYPSRPGSVPGLGSDHIFCIHPAGDGGLWLGSWGGGLLHFDPDNETFAFYDKEDGLANNSVYGILEDDEGYLWISSNDGLSRFDPITTTFTNYGVDDGLQSTEFNGGAYYRGTDGELFFGGINGFNAFFPNKIDKNPFVPPVVITTVKRSNTSLIRPESMAECSELTLPHKTPYFSIEFAALDYTAPNKNQYAYKMEGLDDEWILTDAGNRVASYTFLPPGSYRFRVRGSNNDGVWNESGASMEIEVLPPYYESPWFRLLGIIVVVSVAGWVYRARMKKLDQKRRNLEASLQERTLTMQALQNALNEVERLKNRLEAENTYLQSEIEVVRHFENIITTSPKMKNVLRDAEKVAATDATVLILGESGTGKELVARSLHSLSNRGERLLVRVNCSALPPHLIESELFGHEKGAFTGAVAQKTGRFELADGGTIFLDEIGDLPLELQSKLLRVLQEGEFERVGSSKTLKVDVRVIAATNRDLEEARRKGQFRQDLFFRLNVFPIHLPPLRERKEDIPLLVSHFVDRYGQKLGKRIDNIPQSIIDDLLLYDWPGNIRELENVIERALIISPSGKLLLGNWRPRNGRNLAESSATLLSLSENERRHILRALEMTSWRVSGEAGAARLLGINAKTLESRMRKLGISRPTQTSTRVS